MGMSTINSTIKGKAYEYACVLSLRELISAVRKIEILENESLRIAEQRYCQITDKERAEMLRSSKAGIQEIIKMEPRITEDCDDILTVLLQPDSIAQKSGDVRDVLIIRRSKEWEIGISIKHNHSALKHSRLSAKINFGNDWLGVSCSKEYFDEITPIFDKLKILKSLGEKWSQIPDKSTSVYMPILSAFKREFERLDQDNEDITENLIRYLLGSNGRDYYKLTHNKNRTATIIPFNLYGTLNTSSKIKKPDIIIPGVKLPTRIIELAFMGRSQNTLILTMNNGWSISFRIHNASTIVEPSLKFDIKLQSIPADMFYLNAEW